MFKLLLLENQNEKQQLRVKTHQHLLLPSTIVLQQSSKWCSLCIAIVSALAISDCCPCQLIVALLLLTFPFLIWQHCYLCRMICHIATATVVWCFYHCLLAGTVATCWLLFLKQIIPQSIAAWMAGELLQYCHHCAMMVTLPSLC